MANSETETTADATPAQEVAQDLDELRALAAHLRLLAPTAEASVLRALMGKREALLGDIGARVSRMTTCAQRADADAAPVVAAAQKAVFAQTLREVADMDRESQAALKKRADEAADKIVKLRAGKKWRQSYSR
jgi:hypothetical protein